MHQQRILATVLALLGAFAAFLPWFHAPIIGSINGIQGDGKASLFVYVVVAVVALIGVPGQPFSNGAKALILFPSAAVGLGGLWKLLEFEQRLSQAPQSAIGAALARAAGVDVGLYLTVIVGFAIPLAVVLVPDVPSSDIDPGADDGNEGTESNHRSDARERRGRSRRSRR